MPAKPQRVEAIGRVVHMAGWDAVKVGCAVVMMSGLLSACADRELSAAPTDVADDEPLLTCGGFGAGFPASALTNDSDRPDDIAVALEQLVAEAPVDAPSALHDTEVAEAEWFVLSESGSEMAVAVGSWDHTGPAGPDGQIVLLTKTADGWRSSGWGGCVRLAPVLPEGRAWVQIRASRKPDPSSAEVSVEVSETECVSGRDPRPFLQEPEVVEDDQAVTVFWTSKMTLDPATCPSNPWVEQTLRLKEPLGDRELLDGSRWPAAPITERKK